MYTKLKNKAENGNEISVGMDFISFKFYFVITYRFLNVSRTFKIYFKLIFSGNKPNFAYTFRREIFALKNGP